MQRLIFFGSSAYSVIIFKSLIKINDFPVISIVTKPDKPTGRKQQIVPNPVALFAAQAKIPLFQPQDFDQQFIDEYRKMNPDLSLVVAYGPPYFTQEMIDIPKYKVVNIHPSPLPAYRGATPGPWQIINGETESAITFFQIDEKPDHGPIITQIPFPISPNETSETFYEKAFKLAADNLESVLKSYITNPDKLSPQDHSKRSYFPKLSKESGKIDWSQNPTKIERFVRALRPWPIAWTFVTTHSNNKLTMKIFSGNIKNNQFTPNQVQVEGKKVSSWDQISDYYTITP